MSEDNRIGILTKGIEFLNIFFIAFISLKATGTIACSWWWVAPLSIPILLVLLALMVLVAGHILSDPLRKRHYKKGKEEKKWSLIVDDLLKEKRFELLDIDMPSDTKDRFSLKRWWKEGCTGPTLWQRFVSWYKNGNEQARQKKLAKSEKTS